LNSAATETKMSLYRDSETSPIPGGGISQSALAALLGQTSASQEPEDWVSDFTSSLGQPSSMIDNTRSELNTPTMEFSQNPLFGLGINSQEQTLPEQNSDSLLSEFMGTSVFSSAQHAEINDIWNLDNDDLMHGVCPREVEGNVEKDEGFSSTYESPMMSDPVPETNCMTNSVCYTLSNVTVDDTPTLPSADMYFNQAELVQESTPVVLKSETSPTPDITSTPDVLEWIISEADINSDIPGEEKEEKPLEIPATVTTIDASQLFSNYSQQDIPLNRSFDYPAHESSAGAIRTKRQRNISVASNNSSVDGLAPQPTKRGRGRPPRPLGRPITPAVSKGRIQSGTEDSSDANLTDAEISDLRYRRMRDLNNEASKRCRERRKLKNNEAELELRQLEERHAFLKTKVQKIEALLMRAKNFYLTNMVPSATHIMPDISEMWMQLENTPT